MKKLILSGSALLLSLAFANAQTPGIGLTYAWDDFANAGYADEAPSKRGIFWYSGAATGGGGVHGTRNTTDKTVTFTYPTSGAAAFLAVDFGDSGAETINLTSGSDVQVGIKNTGTIDLQILVYLTDANGTTLQIEPNTSDTKDENGDDLATGVALDAEVATWTAQNLVYPDPRSAPTNPAVYPHVAFNGFILKAGQDFKTYRIDLSSVANAKGGRFLDEVTWWGEGLSQQPANKLPADAPTPFDITKVKSVTFKFNNNLDAGLGLSDHAQNTQSYMYDAITIKQNNWTGSLVFNDFKVGTVLTPLTTGIKTDAAVNGSLKVGPNPTSGDLNVSFESTTDATVSLTDITGNNVSTTTRGAGQSDVKINTSGLQKGMYILNVTTENGKAARKVSVQ